MAADIVPNKKTQIQGSQTSAGGVYVATMLRMRQSRSTSSAVSERKAQSKERLQGLFSNNRALQGHACNTDPISLAANIVLQSKHVSSQ
jgi:hypothetical protein